MKQQIIFKDIIFSPRDKYQIDENGTITTDSDNLKVGIWCSGNGYNYAILKSNTGKNVMYKLDKLVMWAFNKNEALKNSFRWDDDTFDFFVKHKNGDTRDNRLCNLEIVKPKEEWIPLEYGDVYDKGQVRPGFYEISNFGRVRQPSTGRINKIYTNSDKDGYLVVNLMCNVVDKDGKIVSKPKNVKLHRLMASTFVNNPDPDENTVVNHIDGVKTHNFVENLEWITPELNSHMASMMGLYDFSKITTEEIDFVIELLLDQHGSMKKVYDCIDHDKYPRLTYPVICAIKYKEPVYIRHDSKFDLAKIEFTERKRKFTREEVDAIIEGLLDPKCKYSPNAVYEKIHDKFPDIGINQINYVKTKPESLRKLTSYNFDELDFGKCDTKYRLN